MPISRPAVSQHLAVLKTAGLVKDTAQGTRRVYAIDPEGLGPIRAWLDDLWSEHRHLERLGENAAAIRDRLNSGWPGILEAYRQLAELP
jgi:DNA-binding transcriptional ArsR family regulator